VWRGNHVAISNGGGRYLVIGYQRRSWEGKWSPRFKKGNKWDELRRPRKHWALPVANVCSEIPPHGGTLAGHFRLPCPAALEKVGFQPKQLLSLAELCLYEPFWKMKFNVKIGFPGQF
jgi:hypothetical protein